MQIINVQIDKLLNYECNAREHSDQQISDLCSSIKKFGFNDPIECDKDLIIISGHARLQAAKKLGFIEVPVIIHDHLEEDDKKAYILAANKIATNATWDNELLKIELNYLNEINYDLTTMGFNDKEISDLLALEIDQGFFDEDDCPGVAEDPITKHGDVWILGNHRLMCGDSTVQTDYDTLMNGQSPNTMITDPPYGVKYEAGWRSEAKDTKSTEREETSNLMNDDRADWYDAYVLFQGSVAYVWHASIFTDVVMEGIRKSGFEIRQQIIWNKNVHALSRSDYHWKHEPCWYAVKKGGNRNWNGGRTQMTVWDVKSIQSEKDKTSHPTQKPVELYIRSIEHHTNQGEYVYDPFSGSGTLIIACEKTHRRALSMELDPKFCDVIIKRWQKFSNKKAVLESTGEQFNG